MSKQSGANSDNRGSLQENTSSNAKRENNNQLIEMAAEQFVSLLLKHSMLKKNSKLPLFFKPLFWSYKFPLMDPQKNKKRIIIDTINYGGWKHWLWIIKFYGRKEVKKIIEETPKTEFRAPTLKLISLLLDIKNLKYASRSDYLRSQKNI